MTCCKVYNFPGVTTISRNGQNTTTETLIDNILVDNNTNYKSGMILSSISDHFPIFISIETENNISSQEPQEIQYRLIDNHRILSFKADLKNSIINLYTNKLVMIWLVFFKTPQGGLPIRD